MNSGDIFHCPRLQEAFNESKKAIQKRAAILDMVSDDIRNLESLFKNLGAYHEYEELFFSGDRLMHIPSQKPLIETKADIRIEIHKILPQFLKSYIDKQSLEFKKISPQLNIKK